MSRLKREGGGMQSIIGRTPSSAAEPCQPRRADISAAQKNQRRQPRLHIQVAFHQTTDEQEQRLIEAMDLLLAAWIRRRLKQ